MHILALSPGQPASAGRAPGELPADGYVWVDAERSETDWYRAARPWLKVAVHERHLGDSLNDQHPPFYDGTEDYDMLVVRSLDPSSPVDSPVTRAVVLFVTPHALVSVRPAGDPLFVNLRQRLLSGERRSPPSPVALLHLLLNQAVDGLLASREAVSDLLGDWQEHLLDVETRFGDWQALLGLRSQLRRLEILCESEIDALADWRDQTILVLDETVSVRFNDLAEHLRRVLQHALATQSDIDALMQIHFGATGQRTNRILQFLAVISAVFLPLNLVAAIFGMNFEHLPLLHQPWAGWAVLLALAATAGLLLWLFRRRRWI